MRALIVSDIHSNLEALEAVLSAAGACDQVWNLGDSVGYGASPDDVVQRICRLATAGVRGNHDKVCCGLTDPLMFNPAAREAALWTRDHLSPESLRWLREQPAGPLPTASAVLTHGSPLHEDQYLLNTREAWLPLQQAAVPCTFFGHTHVQGGFALQNSKATVIQPLHTRRTHHGSRWTLHLEAQHRYLLNPGSVGQPRDGDPRAAYAILDDAASTVTFHREPYDVDLASGRILLAGLPERLARRLHTGR